MSKTSNNKVFIVHGHDSLKTEVELFLMKLGLEPIILHKQANMGKTISKRIRDASIYMSKKYRSSFYS